MKKIGLSLFLLVVFFGICNNANAIPYTGEWMDYIDKISILLTWDKHKLLLYDIQKWFCSRNRIKCRQP